MLCSQLFTPQIPTLISGQVFRYRCPGSVSADSSSWGSSPGTLIQDEGVCLGILTARANAWFQSLFSCLKGRYMSWSGWAEEGVWGETFYSLAYSSVSVVGPGKSQEPGNSVLSPTGWQGPKHWSCHLLPPGPLAGLCSQSQFSIAKGILFIQLEGSKIKLFGVKWGSCPCHLKLLAVLFLSCKSQVAVYEIARNSKIVTRINGPKSRSTTGHS